MIHGYAGMSGKARDLAAQLADAKAEGVKFGRKPKLTRRRGIASG